MIRNSKQVWLPGFTVKVGFLSLVVVDREPTPGDFAPDAYILRSTDGGKMYRFVPHLGIERIN